MCSKRINFNLMDNSLWYILPELCVSRLLIIHQFLVSNSQGGTLGCLVAPARTSGLSSTQGMVRERAVKVSGLPVSLTNTNDNSTNRVVIIFPSPYPGHSLS